MNYKIDKGVPMPEDRKPKYPFAQMEVGDSVVLPNKAVNAVVKYKHYHPETQFTTRKVADGSVRIWRTK